MEQSQLRILDCGLQIEISTMHAFKIPKSAICIPKYFLLQNSITPTLHWLNAIDIIFKTKKM